MMLFAVTPRCSVHLVFLHAEPRGWEVGPGEGDVAEMGSFSDLGSSLGVLCSP